jgi:fatty acid synthase subunit alpha
MDALEAEGGVIDKELSSSPFAEIKKEALATYGMLEGTDARVDPTCRALAGA